MDDPQPEDGSSLPQYVCLIAVEGFVSFGFIIVFLCMLRSHGFVNYLYTRFDKRFFLFWMDWMDDSLASTLRFGSVRFVGLFDRSFVRSISRVINKSVCYYYIGRNLKENLGTGNLVKGVVGVVDDFVSAKRGMVANATGTKKKDDVGGGDGADDAEDPVEVETPREECGETEPVGEGVAEDKVGDDEDVGNNGDDPRRGFDANPLGEEERAGEHARSIHGIAREQVPNQQDEVPNVEEE